MDSIIASALEEICSVGPTGLTLSYLFTLLQPLLPLTPSVKQSILTNLLNIPTLQFLTNNKPVKPSAIQSLTDDEKNELVIVANESIRDCFVGVYDAKARDGFKGFNSDMLNALQRLASARGNGVTQSQLAREFGKGGNAIFYTLRNLECQGLVTRQTAVVRKEGDMDNRTAVTTNMVYLSRFAKNLGSQERLEINQEKSRCNGSEGGENEECISEDVSVKDYVPAMKAVCDKLAAANDKELFVKDIKPALGYRLGRAHRAWRTVCQRLTDAGLVKEYPVQIGNKTFVRLKLLREFSEKHFKTQYSESCTENLNKDQHNHNNGVISEQLVELPLENQIYDMVDAAGSKGLTLVQLCERLGLNNKRYYNTFINIFSRYGMPYREEGHKKGMVYRVWTSRNFSTDPLDACSDELNVTPSVNAYLNSQAYNTASQNAVANTASESWDLLCNDRLPTGADIEHMDEHVGSSHSSTRADYSNGTNHGKDGGVSSYTGDTIVTDIVPSENFLQPTPISSKAQPHHKDPALAAKREQRILERLQKEKIIVRAELQRWLERLEKDKHSAMDSKTLNRLLADLQKKKLCKCCKVAVPFSSNCRGQRTKDVVLHPSIERLTPEISAQIQERLKFHEVECRTRALKKLKGDLQVPVMGGVYRAPVKIISEEQTQNSEKMNANGFITSTMIRAKLLHIFLWHYLYDTPDWNAVVSMGKSGYDLKNPSSTCKFFVMDDAIKAMPIELFYQVVGSSLEIVQTTGKSMCLNDLSIQEYKCFLDNLAIARLSRVFEVLKRLGLIKLVTEDDEVVADHLVLHSKFKYAFEQNPYIEEPRPTFSSSNSASLDLRPLVRNNYDLHSKDAVDDYWNTLEYLYSAADKTAAAHAFPGSSVPELFRFRSWTSNHIMTAEKRAELYKRLANNDPEKNLSFKDCEKIANDVDLPVQEVLAFKNKRMNRNRDRSINDIEDMMEEFDHPKCHRSSTSRKRKRYPKAEEHNAHKLNTDGRAGSDASTSKSKILELAEDAHLFAAPNEDQVIHSTAKESHKSPLIDGDKHHPFGNQSLYPTRKVMFSWNLKAERHLVIQYARHRAALGARFHRAEWTALENLPAPPDTCKRRMALLKGNPEFRTALSKLLNMLSKKYVKFLKKTRCKLLTDCNEKTVAKDLSTHDFLVEGDDTVEKWDDFDCGDIKMALDEVLKHTQLARQQKFDKGHHCNNKRLRKSCSVNRARIPGKLVKALSKGGRDCKQVYESLAASNAVELFKLVFLSTLASREVPNCVAETLRRYSKHDLYAAFSYLREKKILVGGSGGSSFELSQYFLQRFSASPFPADTGEKASKFVNWIDEKEHELIEEGTNLFINLECGDIFELFSLVATGELSIMPCLPDDGVGELEDSLSLKRHADSVDLPNENKAKRPKRSSMMESEITYRREKGFPAMKVIMNRTMISSKSAIASSPDKLNCNEDGKHHQEGNESACNLIHHDRLKKVVSRSHTKHFISDHNASPWEAMVEYATCLTSKSSDQKYAMALNSGIFKDIYEAIIKAGDQGLAFKDISEFVDKQGNSLGQKMAVIAIEILQAFGLTIQVNAYDTVHVVDSLHRSKYQLTIATESSQPCQQLSKSQVISDGTYLVTNKDQHAVSDGSELPLTETGVVNSHAHCVNILNLPVEVPSSLKENICVQGDTSANKFSTSSILYFPILPWMNLDGTINKSIYNGLVRRVMGSIMQNPGMLEDGIIRRMDVLNPQSCRKLLEQLILENHIIVRKMRQVNSGEPPSILGSLLKKNFNRPSENVLWREHFFANPASSHLL